MELRLEILPPQQQALWPELASTPEHFVLYGGTALALRLGHRQSVDFDFFAEAPIDVDGLLRDVHYLYGALVQNRTANSLTCLVYRQEQPVQVQFFGALGFRRLRPVAKQANWPVALASLEDLAGTKAKALLDRVHVKDYLDVLALLEHGIPLEAVLAYAYLIFGEAAPPMVVYKSLAYLEHPELTSLPGEAKQRLGSYLEVDTVAFAQRLEAFLNDYT